MHCKCPKTYLPSSVGVVPSAAIFQLSVVPSSVMYVSITISLALTSILLASYAAFLGRGCLAFGLEALGLMSSRLYGFGFRP